LAYRLNVVLLISACSELKSSTLALAFGGIARS